MPCLPHLPNQDCLVEWLRSRGGGGGGRDGAAGADDASALQAQRCELCREKLVFRARYRPGAPAQLGVSQVCVDSLVVVAVVAPW